MNRNETNKTIWRLLILDVSGVYTQIYDEIYGNNPNTLSELLELYSDEKNISVYHCRMTFYLLICNFTFPYAFFT